MSIEALYGVEFASNVLIDNGDNAGFGIAVLETQRILGGDSSFLYVGDYECKDGILYANVKCTNDRKSLRSVFGDINEFNLCLAGKPANDEFMLKGYMVENPNMKIDIKMTRRAELP